MEDVMLLLGCYPEWNDSDVTFFTLTLRVQARAVLDGHGATGL